MSVGMDVWVGIGIDVSLLGVGVSVGLPLGWLRRVHMLLRSSRVSNLRILVLYQPL